MQKIHIAGIGYSFDDLFFTSDHHFYHEKVIEYCSRPFLSAEEMNEIMVERWNKVVPSKALVVHTGDFGFFKNQPNGTYDKLRKRLNGRILLTLGDHDKPRIFLNNSRKDIILEGFVCIKEKRGRTDEIIACHYSMNTWPKKHYGTKHVFGHSHGSTIGIGASFDCGVDSHDFYPWSFEEAMEKFKTLVKNEEK